MASVASTYPSCEAEHSFKLKAKSALQLGRTGVCVGGRCFPECCVCLASPVLLNYVHSPSLSWGPVRNPNFD